jgi:hypothetical protein
VPLALGDRRLEVRVVDRLGAGGEVGSEHGERHARPEAVVALRRLGGRRRARARAERLQVLDDARPHERVAGPVVVGDDAEEARGREDPYAPMSRDGAAV